MDAAAVVVAVDAIATIAVSLGIFPAIAPPRGREDVAAAVAAVTATTAANRAISRGTAPNRDKAAEADAEVVEAVATATSNATSAAATVTCLASARLRIETRRRDVCGFSLTFLSRLLFLVS